MRPTSLHHTGIIALFLVASLALAPALKAQGADADLTLPELPALDIDTDEDPNAIRVLLSPEVETVMVAQVDANVEQLNVRLGQRVRKDDVLVALNCSETQARLRMAEAENRGARETLNNKHHLRKLEAAGDYEIIMAQSEADRTAAAIAISQAQLEHCEVTAPFDGHVVKVHIKPHQGVSSGTPLIELVSDGPLKIRLNVPSRLLSQIEVGTPLEVVIYETEKRYQAHVSAINARIDAVAQTIELEATLDEPYADLLPGMSGVAQLRL